MNILFVCTGNTCRSPMAEAILRHRSDNSIQVRSAGIFASNGSPASRQSVEVLQDKGIKINHQSQALTEELVEWADLVLTMTGQHKQAILSQFPSKIGHIFTLKEHVLAEKETLDNLEQLYDKIGQIRMELFDLGNSDEDKRQALMREMETKMKEAKKIERTMPSMDVSDPFGGSKDVYCQTYEELDELVQKLAEKYS